MDSVIVLWCTNLVAMKDDDVSLSTCLLDSEQSDSNFKWIAEAAYKIIFCSIKAVVNLLLNLNYTT